MATRVQFDVMTQAGTKTVVCNLTEKKTVVKVDGKQAACRKQVVDVVVDGQTISYVRVRYASNWLPWIDVEVTHSSRSLRGIVEFWAR